MIVYDSSHKHQRQISNVKSQERINEKTEEQ